MADSMPFNVSDVKVCARDNTQMEILEIYALKPPEYAVYRTATRVTIKFADDNHGDDSKEKGQRAAIAKLNPLRSDISGLIDGWRLQESCRKGTQDCGCSDRSPKVQYVRPACLPQWLEWADDCLWKRRKDRLATKARRYDRSVADGLVLALEGDFDTAAAQLQSTKDAIVAERTSRARFEYLLSASVACFVIIGASWMLWNLPIWIDPKYIYGFTSFLMLAASAGSVGAFFSVAIAIRSRTVLTDLQQRDNTLDAYLRIAIGAIGAAFFIAALREKVAVLTFGTLSTTLISSKSPDWLAILVAAFAAGFSERLVPDLLDKAALNTGNPAPAPKPTAPPPAAPTGGSVSGGGGPNAPKGPMGAGGATGDVDKDGCSAAIPAGQETPDSELPPARGGVAN
jgi:hypothetical protein